MRLCTQPEKREQSMDVRKKAAEALVEQQKVAAKQKHERKVKNHDLLCRNLDKRLGATLEDFEEAGIKIRYAPFSFQIYGKCPQCDMSGWSWNFEDWAKLGELLEEFRLDSTHFCPALRPMPQLPSELLREAMLELLGLE